MAVVIHGSFDEGPITLALPDYFDSVTNESDPIFSAWDKSTGITITQSQITDGDTLVNDTDLTDVTIDTSGDITANNITADNDITATGTILGSNLSGTNTGDEDLSGLVPYAGATGNVNLGVNDLTVNMITLGGTTTDPTDAATKSYVDSIIITGITWKTAVIDTVVNAAALPALPDVYDRYITIDNGHIREWGGVSWSDTTPSTGDTLYISENSETPDNEVGIHTYNGSSWVYIGGSINHNDTGNKQGGATGEYYHLAAANSTAVGYVTTTTADATPTTLALSTQGISTGSDGTQSAYVVLSWDAIVTDTFDHYHVQYKKTAFTYYQSLDAHTNTITIEGLTPNVSYDFRIASVNKYGTLSAYCTVLTLTTNSDDGIPGDVTIDSATAGIQYVIIEWTHNTDADLASYKVYRHTADISGSAVEIGNCRTNYFVDGGLTGDQIYYYWIKAVDTSGNVSSNFSSSVNATPRNVETTDVTQIASTKILIDGEVLLSNWRHTDDITKIDGGRIYANSVTTTQLNFVPTDQDNIVATINATTEGTLQIEGEHIEINGMTTFTPIDGKDGSKLYIYPDANTAIQITDDDAKDVFNVQIGGTNVGDVTIGDYTGGQGIKYVKSTGTTTFAGAIAASSGTISGLTSFGTHVVSIDGKNQSIALSGNDLYETAYAGNDTTVYINRLSAGGGTSYYRNTILGNGKGNVLLGAYGSSKQVYIAGGLVIDDPGAVSGYPYLRVPRMTTAQRTNIPASISTLGAIVYDTNLDQFVGVIEYPIGSGSYSWWRFGMH